MSLIRSRPILIGGISLIALIVLVLIVSIASADLTGSNFEIDEDANLLVDGVPPAIDWAVVTETRKTDVPSGSEDDSFTGGTKEDTEPPVASTGSIPPNKSDLKTFGVYTEEYNGFKYLALFWTRVQDPSGTTNMDFEFNQSTTPSANGVTPIRTPGDLLIVYELSKGGTVPVLAKLTWLDGTEDNPVCEASNSFPCWGDRTELTSSDILSETQAIGSINTSPISAADSDGLGPLDPRTFGEALIDLDLIFEAGQCQSFGSAYLKSRSSDSFTAALKDFIAPIGVNISNCGTVTIEKKTDPSGESDVFSFTTSLVTDPADGSPFQLSDGGTKVYTNVVVGGPYTISESTVDAGYTLTDIDCSTSDVSVDVPAPEDISSNRTVTFTLDTQGESVYCIFTNSKLPTITVIKEFEPEDDGGKVDFNIGGVLRDNDDNGEYGSGPGYGDGESVQVIWPVSETVTISETNHSPTSLDDYVSSVDCGSEGSEDGTSIDVEVGYGDDIVCTFTNQRKPTIKVIKEFEPSDDGGTVDFNIGGDLYDNNGTVPYGLGDGYGDGEFELVTWPVSETIAISEIGNSDTDLSDYVSSVACVSDDGSEGISTPSGTQINGVEADYGDNIVCTFTNQRKPTITVIKDFEPDDGGLVDFSIAGVLFDTGYGDGGSKTVTLTFSNTVTISETGHTGTDLNDYVSSVDCGSEGSDDGTSIDVEADFGDNIVCTFTNRPKPTITVEKVFEPSDDGGRVDFSIDGISYDDGEYPNGPGYGHTGSETVTLPISKTITISETGHTGTDLTNYVSDVYCEEAGGGFEGSNTGTSIDGVKADYGDDITCTFTNRRIPELTLVKEVSNTHGLTQTADIWTLEAFAIGDTKSFSGTGAPESDERAILGPNQVNAGVTYTLSESVDEEILGYVSSGKWECSVNGIVEYPAGVTSITLQYGEVATCTIVNEDTPAEPSGTTIQKWILHDKITIEGIRPGGTPVMSATFTLYSDANCTVEVGSEGPITVIGGEAETSTGIEVTAPGTYYWIASFTGNSYNNGNSTSCGDEMTTIEAIDAANPPPE